MSHLDLSTFMNMGPGLDVFHSNPSISITPASRSKTDETKAKEPETDTTATSDLDEEDDLLSTYQLEKDVGIIEYISQHEGFYGILKERYKTV